MTAPPEFVGGVWVAVRLISDDELTRLEEVRLAQDARRCRPAIEAQFLNGWKGSYTLILRLARSPRLPSWAFSQHSQI
jgi:hypothetical protein